VPNDRRGGGKGENRPTAIDLRRLDPQVHRRVLEALESLAENPFQGRKLTYASVGEWRIRVGDYRIRYDIDGSGVLLYRVQHRREICRALRS
jgi:mRNA interferase RelE/StbE